MGQSLLSTLSVVPLTSGFINILDIDECTENDECNRRERCINTFGSFVCVETDVVGESLSMK